MKLVFSCFLLPAGCFLLALCCVLFSAFIYPLSAQVRLSVKGAVADSITLKPLAYVTLGLKNDKNEAIKTGLSNEDGSFMLNALQPGKYTLHIVAMGYQRRSLSIDLREDTDLFTIYIKPESTTLGGVTVIADKPLVKMDVDKISYDLQADPEAKVNSVLEMIRKVPLLTLDHEDNIQLKGSGSYRIMINGRPSAMLEKNPKDILRSMPASTIQSIEVITNPPAKFDGEGLAGIINIVTVKKIDNGYNGNVNINHRFPRGGPGLGSSFNFKQGKFGISVNGFGNVFSNPWNIYFNDRTVFGTNPSSLRQDGEVKNRTKNMGGSAQLSYEIDSLNLISIQFAANVGEYDGVRNLQSLLQTPDAILEAYRMSSENSGKWYGRDASLNYQLGFRKSKQQLLTLSYRYLKLYDDRHSFVMLKDKMNYFLPDFHQFNEGGPQEQTVQLDYVHPFRKAIMESGVKGIFRNNYSDFRYSSKNLSNGFDLDPALSNQYDNIQNVISFYNSWQLSLKEWSLKAGIRLEQTNINADFISSGILTKQDYINLLPSFSVSKKFKSKTSMGITYSQRIQRPNIWDLNPYVDRSNPNLESTGNPALRPVSANNFQLTYNRSGKTSFNVILSHSFSNNALQYYLLYDAAANVNRFMPDNTGTNNTTGVNINIAHPITSRWNYNFTSNLNYVRVKGYVGKELVGNEGMTGNFMVSTSYRFEKGWRASGNINYALTPYLNLQGSGIAIFFSGFSVNKDLFKEKLSLSAQFSNPFNKHMYFPNNILTTDYEFVSSSRGWFRAFSYGLNYKFGKLKSQVAKNKRGIDNDDVSGGGRSPH